MKSSGGWPAAYIDSLTCEDFETWIDAYGRLAQLQAEGAEGEEEPIPYGHGWSQ